MAPFLHICLNPSTVTKYMAGCLMMLMFRLLTTQDGNVGTDIKFTDLTDEYWPHHHQLVDYLSFCEELDSVFACCLEDIQYRYTSG